MAYHVSPVLRPPLKEPIRFRMSRLAKSRDPRILHKVMKPTVLISTETVTPAAIAFRPTTKQPPAKVLRTRTTTKEFGRYEPRRLLENFKPTNGTTATDWYESPRKQVHPVH